MILVDFVLTSTASIVANLFTHPLETIKVRQMIHGGMTVTVGYQLVINEGPLALYKGINAAIIRAIISGGGRLTGFDALKTLAIHLQIINEVPSVKEIPIRAAMAVTAGCFAQFCAAPVDLIRTRQAAFKGKTSQTPSIVSVARLVYRENGVAGLFSGSSALLGRAASFNIAQLLTYDDCKAKAARWTGRSDKDVVVHVLAACGAGVAATTASAPFENLKTYKQMESKITMGEAVRKIYANGGLRAFFRGWTPLYMKIAPHTLIVLVTLEHLRNLANAYGLS